MWEKEERNYWAMNFIVEESDTEKEIILSVKEDEILTDERILEWVKETENNIKKKILLTYVRYIYRK